MLLLTKAYMVCTVVFANGVCKSDMDCSLNGECAADKTCSCDPPWTGKACSVLDIAFPHNVSTSYVAPEGTSSWGMSVIRENKTGLYHGACCHRFSS